MRCRTGTIGPWAMAALAAALAAGAGAAARAAIPAAAAAAATDPALWEKPPLLAAGDGPAAATPATGTRGFDVLDYALDLDLDLAAKRVRGAVTIALRAGAAPLAAVLLDLHPDLAVDTVLWNGTAAPLARDGEALTVTPPSPLAPGADAVLRIAYAGAPPQGVPPLGAGLMFRRHGDETADPADDAPIVANVSEPSTAHTWWPCKDDPSDKATATIAVTAPDSLSVVSNGTLLAVTAPAPGRRRWVWRERHPIATYLVSIAVSNYVRWDETCDCAAGALPLAFHVFPQDEAHARADLAPTCAIVRFLESLAGPYPFGDEKYAQAAIRWGGAMENQTATSLGQLFLTGDGRHASVFVHELAHQWFGDLVTPSVWRDIWLNEGFARYAEALWLERTQGRDAYFAELRRIGPQRHTDLFTDAGILTDPSPVLPNLLVYDKGAWVLHILRGQIGDAAFFRFVRAWTGDPARAYGQATTADLVVAASAAAGRDLAPLLRPWLDTAAVPELAWSVRATPLASGRTRVTLTVAQRQSPCFPLELPVRIVTDAGVFERRAPLSGPRAVCAWDLAGRIADPPRAVTLDPDGWLLWRAATSQPAVPAVTLLGVAPNPARTTDVVFSFTLREAARVTARLYDARGRGIGAWALGERRADEVETWSWDRRDDRGRPVPTGVYWMEIAVGGERATRKLTILR